MYNGILFEKQKFLDKYKENGNICINW
jgi:hypothetical protein